MGSPVCRIDATRSANGFLRWVAEKTWRFLGTAAVGLAVSTVSAYGAAVSVTGAGATFPAPLYASWAHAYAVQGKGRVNYQALGSGSGIQQITAGSVDFGASDEPLSEADLLEKKLVQFPAVVGGVVPVVNLPGVGRGQLKLSGEVLADLFLGAIRSWADPRIVALNPGMHLPKLPVTLVYRSDSSGTTANFTQYLSGFSPEFRKLIGSGKVVNWSATRATGIGGKGNAGVAALLSKIEGAIGYTEYSFSKKGLLSFVSLKNEADVFVMPSGPAFGAALSAVDWHSAVRSGLHRPVAYARAQAWPITAVTYVLLPKHPRENTSFVWDFFLWGMSSPEGRQLALELGYVSLPEVAVTEIKNLRRGATQPETLPVIKGVDKGLSSHLL